MLWIPHARAYARAWLVAACLAGLPTLAVAAQLRISPLSLSLTPGQRSTTVTLHNESDTPVTVQVRAFDWRQDAEVGMLLNPTSDIALSPVIATLAPGATQIVRMQARVSGDNVEHYYRILFDELPSSADASHDKIQVLTRYSLPLFIEPRVAGLPKLNLRLQQCTDGRKRLYIANAGERRARLGDWRLRVGEQILATHSGLAGYALAGSALVLPLPDEAGASPGAALFEVNTDLGSWQADLSSSAESVSCPQRLDPG